MTRIHKSACRTMVLTAGLVALASCGGDSSTAPEPPRATAISISPPSVTLEFIGATETFTATITDQNGAAFAGAVAWSSEQPEIFTVNGGGVVTAVSNGSGTVRASLGSLSATATVTVAQVVSAIEVVSGDGQSGLTGDVLPEPVVVRVVDSGGAPVAETTVTFEPGEGHGTASPATAVSDADGEAQSTWTLGEFIGTQTLTASVAGGPSTTFTATAVGPRVTLDSGAGSSPEGGVVTLGLTVDPVPETAISVRYTLRADGDPVTEDADGSDYTDGGGGAVEIAAGASSAAIEIAVNDDDEIEPVREVFTVTLDTPGGDAGYGLGVVVAASVTIEEGVCDRTPQVRNEIVQQAGVGDCVEVEDRHLAHIRRLDLCFPKYEWMECELEDDLITALREGDFLGLSGLAELDVQGNGLTGLPAGVFAGLSRLEGLYLGFNRLAELPEGVFAGLSSLEWLEMPDNRLSELPAGVFAGLSSLRSLELDDNALTELPAGVFAGLSSLEGLSFYGNPRFPFTLTLEVIRTDSDDPMSPGPATLEVRLSEGTPFAMTIPLSARGGMLSTPSVSLAAGATVSTEATLTPSGSGVVSVAVGPVATVCEVDPGPGTKGLECPGLEIVAGGPLVVANPRCRTVALSVPAAYLTQATQDLNGGVPLIAGRQALLRVFGTVDEPYTLGRQGQATFFVHGREVYRASLEPPASGIPLEVDEGRLDQSFNARIPGHVLQPGLEMVVELDPDAALPLKPGSRSRFPASARHALDVRDVPPMDLTIIPVLYDTEANRSTNPEVEDFSRDLAGADSGGRMRYTRDVLPIGDLNVKLREPYYTFADITRGGTSQIIYELNMLRHLEAGRDEYYHGIFEEPNTERAGSDPRCNNCWSSKGEEPGHTAVSLAGASTVFAHEFGHNLSLEHAPCGNALGFDPDFPYGDGSIGVWGHRFIRSDDTGFGYLLGPEAYKDVMSYCNRVWISDYHFAKALNHRLGIASAPAVFAQRATAQQTLLLWGGVQEGEVRLEPPFAHDARLELPEAFGPYQLEGLDAEGRRLFSLSFTPDELDHGGSSFLFAIPFEPEWTEDLDRVTLTGPEGSTTLDRDTGGRAR